MPLQVQLETMRALYDEAHKGGELDLALMKEASAVAAQCAVYVHPRLSAMSAKIESVMTLSDAVVDARFGALLDTLARLNVPDDFEANEPPALSAPIEAATE